MKLASAYRKEMTIAFRGFYFYVEIVIALILLAVLLLAVDEYPEGREKEYAFYDASPAVVDAVFAELIEEGTLVPGEPEELTMKPASFEVVDEAAGTSARYSFDDARAVAARTMLEMDRATGRKKKTIYLLDSEDDLLRLSFSSGGVGAVIRPGDDGRLYYRYILQGYETERVSNLLYALHARSLDELGDAMDGQAVRSLGPVDRLNARETTVPLFVTFAGSLMGFFIVMAYLYLDKNEGAIKAISVTPATVRTYLLSKTLVIMSTVLVSSSIVVIPVMGAKPDYLLFYPFLLATTFAFAALGLFVASFFDSMDDAFGALYVIMIAFMLPAFSYLIGSFDPVWLRFFPTYPVLQVFKAAMLGKTDVPYALAVLAGFLAGGAAILLAAEARFKKTLTV
ncbi:MAG: ABC transporter permease [Spirochaetaceae bacterium]|nr:ABC transporter permease [Spirochaetaceae bacterium]